MPSWDLCGWYSSSQLHAISHMHILLAWLKASPGRLNPLQACERVCDAIMTDTMISIGAQTLSRFVLQSS